MQIQNCIQFLPRYFVLIMSITPEVKELMKCFYTTDDEYTEQRKLYLNYLNKRKIRTSNKTKKELMNQFLNSDVLDEFLRTKLNNCLFEDFSICITNETFDSNTCFSHSVLNTLEHEFLMECKEKRHYSRPFLVEFVKNSDMFRENLSNIISRAFVECKSTVLNKIDVDYLFMKLKNMDTENYNYAFITQTVKDFDPLDNVFRIHELTSSTNFEPSQSNVVPTVVNPTNDDISECKRDFLVDGRTDDQSFCENNFSEMMDGDNFETMTKTNEDTCLIFKNFNEYDKRNPTNEEVNDIKLLLGNKVRLVHIVRAYMGLTNSPHFKGVVDGFEEVFDRPISIYEFQKYYNASVAWKDHSTKAFNDYYVSVKEVYAKAESITKNTYKLFLGKTVDEFFMLKNHWRIFDVNDYETQLIDHITKQPEYDDIMRECIRAIYHKQYEKEIEPYDMEYVLYHIKSKQLHTKSDELSVVINDLYTETQGFKDLIHGVFASILNRLPDRLEVKYYVTKFRKDMSNAIEFDEQNTIYTIQRDLYNNIEYNDVLKKNIISIGNDKLLPSQVNNLMSKIINWDTDHKLKMDMDLLADFVKQEMPTVE